MKSLYDYCIENHREELLRQWHPSQNVPLTPETVSYGSKKKVWWRCERGHEWEAMLYSRTSASTGCPYCKSHRIWKGSNALASENPELAAQWHPTRNAELTPQQVSVNSHRKVWWICELGHEWQAVVKSRQEGADCPICKNKMVLSGENDFATTHPSIAAQWHPTKNGTLTPSDIFAGTRRKVWWLCEKKHEWKAIVSSRTSGGAGCPVCAGKIIIPGENDLASSFPEVAAQWHPTKNDRLTPEMVSPYSNKKAWWLCDRGHAYQSVISGRTGRGNGCVYCTGVKVLAGFNDLATLDPLLAKQWHSELNGSLLPDQVTTGSHKKVWWECPNGHIWKAVIYSRARDKKVGCPVCAGKVREEQQERYRSITRD